MSTQLEKYKEALKSFISSNKDKEAIYAYSVAVWTATRSGGGLSFNQIAEIIDETYKEYTERNDV
jgi:hypothetical protein